MAETGMTEEERADATAKVDVTASNGNGEMESLPIVKSLEAAKEKIGSGLFGRDERKAIMHHIEQAKYVVMRQLEWEASQQQFMQLVTNLHDETLAARDEARSLREQAVDLHKAMQERQAKVEALEGKLLEGQSRVQALEAREESVTERERALDASSRKAHEDLEGRRAEVLGLMENVKEDLTRMVALEQREKTVADRESTLTRKDEHLNRVEGEVSEVLQKNHTLNVKFEEYNAVMLKRLDDVAAKEERLDDRVRQLEYREKAVEGWKLDLANRESELNAKLDEVNELTRRKEALEVELGELREQRFREVEEVRREIRDRDADLQRREKETAALARALSERNVKLVERKQALDEYEGRLDEREEDLDRLRRELKEREARIETLEGRITTLETQRKDLVKSLAKIRGEI